MHEFSITKSIVGILERVGNENKADRITKVNLELSPVASIEPESVKFYYGYLTENNAMLKGAELIFEKSEIDIRCLDCKKTFRQKQFKPVCPECGGSRIVMKEIDDIKIISVET